MGIQGSSAQSHGQGLNVNSAWALGWKAYSGEPEVSSTACVLSVVWCKLVAQARVADGKADMVLGSVGLKCACAFADMLL